MPENPINTLQASPNGELTNLQVREKINEVLLNTNGQNNTIDHFKFNAEANRLEADVVIQAGLNSFAWGEAWTQSSVAVLI